MRHEKESAELANKLVLMKNQILDFNIGKSLQRKYGGVKTSGSKPLPVLVSINPIKVICLA